MNLEKLKEITEIIKSMICSEEFLAKSRKTEKAFTRVRKLTFTILLAFMLNLSSRSLQLEVDSFLESTTGNDDIDWTKQAVSKAKAKISPEAFIILNSELKSVFYKKEDYKRYKGYRLLSVDGSTVELPNVSVLAKKYGVFNSKSVTANFPAARISVLYDNLNNIILDSAIGEYKSSERDYAKAHLINLIASNKDLKIDISNDLVIFDRGYPSLELIYFMEYFGIKYLFRITHSFLKETNAVIEENFSREKTISVELTKKRIKDSKLTEINPNVKAGDTTLFKLAIITLKTGQEEYLITNAMELKYEELEELYNIRWKIETCYDELKNKIELENFTGLTPNSIEQDFFSSVFVFNYASLIAMTAQAEYEVEVKLSEKEKKYAYKVNKNMVIGHLKNRIIRVFLTEDIDKTLKYLIRKAKKNMTAIKTGRSFQRNKNHKPKFPVFRKRAI